MNLSKLSLLGTVFAISIAVGSASAACTDATLKGPFGFLHVATDSEGNKGTTVGQVTFDGEGNLSGTETSSNNGTISTETFSGTYSVAKNCTGNATVVNEDKSTAHFNFIVDDAKKGFQLIETDSGIVRTGFGLAQGKAICGLTGKKQTLAVSLTGTGEGIGPVAGVGQIILNGAGTLSGSSTFNQAGTVVTVPLTGTYSAKSDCTGTAQVTLSGFPTSNYNTILVDAGKEILMIETDANTIVSGTMQQ